MSPDDALCELRAINAAGLTSKRSIARRGRLLRVLTKAYLESLEPVDRNGLAAGVRGVMREYRQRLLDTVPDRFRGPQAAVAFLHKAGVLGRNNGADLVRRVVGCSKPFAHVLISRVKVGRSDARGGGGGRQ